MKDHQLLLKLPPIQFKVDIVGSDQLSESTAKARDTLTTSSLLTIISRECDVVYWMNHSLHRSNSLWSTIHGQH